VGEGLGGEGGSFSKHDDDKSTFNWNGFRSALTSKLALGSFLAEGIPFISCWVIFGWWEGFVFGIFMGKIVNRYLYFPLVTGKTFWAWAESLEEE
jgi:hypothetical protein